MKAIAMYSLDPFLIKKQNKTMFNCSPDILFQAAVKSKKNGKTNFVQQMTMALSLWILFHFHHLGWMKLKNSIIAHYEHQLFLICPSLLETGIKRLNPHFLSSPSTCIFGEMKSKFVCAVTNKRGG